MINDNKHLEYLAFISYRHADNREEDKQWATWLHQQLETYEVPAELIGTKNLRGQIIPDRIYPVFIDSLSLPADANLSSAITEALERSNSMVVLCAPGAVASNYVNQEIRYFKQQGRSDRIIAALLEGEPNASIDAAKIEDPANLATQECFPQALQYHVNDQGELITDQPTEPIAAEFRLPDQALAITPDGLTTNKGFTSVSAFERHCQNTLPHQTKAEKVKLKKHVAQYEQQLNTAKLKIVAGILGVPLEQLTQRDKAYQLAKAEAATKRFQKIAAGLGVLALAAITAGSVAYVQFKKADELLSQVRTNLNFMNYNVRDALINYVPIEVRTPVMEQIDTLTDTLKTHNKDDEVSKQEIATSLSQKADFLLQNNNLDPSKALQLYLQAHAIIKELVDKSPNNADLQQNLAVSSVKLGDIELSLNHTDVALQHYQASYVLRKALATKYPDIDQSQSDLSISYERLGHIELLLGHTDTSLQHFQASLILREALVRKKPDNTQFQSDLSVAYIKIGDAELRLGHSDDALQHFQSGLKIAQGLVEHDPDNTEYLLDLSIAYNRLGDIERYLGHTKISLQHLLAGLKVEQTQVAKDPSNTQFQRGLAIAYNKLCDIELRLDHTKLAKNYCQKGMTIRQSLIEHDPSNIQFQRELSISYGTLGKIERELGNPDSALQHLRSSLNISKELSTQNLDNAEIQRDLFVSYWSIGSVFEEENNVEAINYFQQSLEQLLFMQKEGVLDKNDEGWIDAAKNRLKKLDSPAN